MNSLDKLAEHPNENDPVYHQHNDIRDTAHLTGDKLWAAGFRGVKKLGGALIRTPDRDPGPQPSQQIYEELGPLHEQAEINHDSLEK